MSEGTRHSNDLVFEQLHAMLIDLDRTLKQALGFTRTVKYRGITFYINQFSVIANLAPLAFLHLTEPIGTDGTDVAVERLHDRVLPLLACRHQWGTVDGLNGTIGTIAEGTSERGSTLHRCNFCTAYALKYRDTSLPVLGKEDA